MKCLCTQGNKSYEIMVKKINMKIKILRIFLIFFKHFWPRIPSEHVNLNSRIYLACIQAFPRKFVGKLRTGAKKMYEVEEASVFSSLPLPPSRPSSLNFCFCSRSNFRAIARSETFSTQTRIYCLYSIFLSDLR